MELTLISENKIKISLTRQDLDEHGITSDALDYDNTETRRVFWTLLDEARKKTGFDAAKNRIFIQIYPSRDGGCELFVSKITDTDEDNRYKTEARKGNEKRTAKAVYRFEKMQELISVCKRLHTLGYRGRASAYSEDKTRFFLSFDETVSQAELVGEYGERQSTEGALLYIKEHCVTICEGEAVSRLAKL